jgi:hypothetical protein
MSENREHLSIDAYNALVEELKVSGEEETSDSSFASDEGEQQASIQSATSNPGTGLMERLSSFFKR